MKVKWFSGPPPAVGWWPCSFDSYSWWSGEFWSVACHVSTDADMADIRARQKSSWSESKMWRHWSIEIDGTDGRGAHL